MNALTYSHSHYLKWNDNKAVDGIILLPYYTAFYHKVQYFKAFTTKYNTLMLVQRLQYCRTNIKPA